MNNYNTGEWVKVENVGEMKKILELFPNNVKCEVNIRFKEVISGDDERIINSIQFSQRRNK